jgi:hypothetical protein
MSLQATTLVLALTLARYRSCREHDSARRQGKCGGEAIPKGDAVSMSLRGLLLKDS